MITTENLTIDPEMCKRLDRAIYGTFAAPEKAKLKANLYRHEMMNKLQEINPTLYDHFSKHEYGLFYLYSTIKRILIDEGKSNQERRSANIETARNQLKNWK